MLIILIPHHQHFLEEDEFCLEIKLCEPIWGRHAHNDEGDVHEYVQVARIRCRVHKECELQKQKWEPHYYG